VSNHAEGSRRAIARRFVPSVCPNFVDPEFPPPTMEVWTELRHHWLAPIPNAEAVERF
jgi:hypothetical protein